MVTFPQRRNGLNARRMAVLSTFCEPSLWHHVHRELWRSVLLDVTPIISATACHQRNYVERYSRPTHSKHKSLTKSVKQSNGHPKMPATVPTMDGIYGSRTWPLWVKTSGLPVELPPRQKGIEEKTIMALQTDFPDAIGLSGKNISH